MGFYILRHLDPQSGGDVFVTIFDTHQLEGIPLALDELDRPVCMLPMDPGMPGNDECWVLLGPFSTQEYDCGKKRHAYASKIGGVVLPEDTAESLIDQGMIVYSDG